jgi:soluble lytic murein transglycosylase-like protein
LFARRNLIIVAVGMFSLGASAPAIAATSDDLRAERERIQQLGELGPDGDGDRDGGGRKRPERASAKQGDAIAGVPRATLESIASCESGGDPTAVSADGSYRGKYQFDTGTWASVGGKGDPAAAPEAEQDYRAALLYSRAGSSPWPVCG